MREIARASQMAQLDDWLATPRLDQQYDRHRASRLDGTCEWIFDHVQYKAWRSEEANDSRARILWICGPPGFGKTILCARIVEKLRQENRLVAYAFCSAFAQAGLKPDVIVRCWIRQLVHQDESILDTVWQHPARGAQPVASTGDVFDILGAIVAAKRECMLVVDGIDEIAQSSGPQHELENLREEVFGLLKSAIAGSNSRVLIVSRQDVRPELSSVMRGSVDPTLLTCQLTSREVQTDIQTFSTHLIETKLPSQKEFLRLELAAEMVEKWDGMFLWIKMQEGQLRDYKTKEQLRRTVSRMPKGLHHTFERSWKDIQQLSDFEEQERAVAILRWAAYAFNPLTVRQMAEALLVEEDPEMEDFEIPSVGQTYEDEGITRLCGSLIEIRQNRRSRTVEIVHASAKEYILSPESHIGEFLPGHLQLSDTRVQHAKIAETCLQFLNNEGVWRCFTTNTFSSSDFLCYAALYWYCHILESNLEDFYGFSPFRLLFQPENCCFKHWGKYVEERILWGASHTKVSTPLYYAAIFDLLPRMTSFQRDATISINDTSGRYGTALQACCIRGNQASFECLLN